MRSTPFFFAWIIMSLSQSMAVAEQRGMLQKVAPLCGPTSVKKLGKPGVCMPM